MHTYYLTFLNPETLARTVVSFVASSVRHAEALAETNPEFSGCTLISVQRIAGA